ncbi:MAG: glucosamine-6-phosphate deaminase [Clostridia bacterium]
MKIQPIKEWKVEELRVKVYRDRRQMGQAAAWDVAQNVRRLALDRKEINMVFAAAPSQNEFLEAFNQEELPWEKINAFHMDEYIGLPEDAPQGFGNFLRVRLFDKHAFRNVFYFHGNAANRDEEQRRMEACLKAHPLDMACMGIGENGHIAFNDPHVADFQDPCMVKVVDLDETCRAQQVHDGCFASLDQVPRYAFTMTIPVLVAPKAIHCIVPAKQKAEAVRRTLLGPVSEECPASILRRCPGAVLYLDQDSASLLDI